jgi:hypothetical protein
MSMLWRERDARVDEDTSTTWRVYHDEEPV